MKIVLAESAVRDLEEAVAYYAERQVPDVGARLVGEVLERIESLAVHPDSGRVVPEFEAPQLRELIHPPFRIVYRRESKRVSILRVWRGERPLELPDV